MNLLTAIKRNEQNETKDIWKIDKYRKEKKAYYGPDLHIVCLEAYTNCTAIIVIIIFLTIIRLLSHLPVCRAVRHISVSWKWEEVAVWCFAFLRPWYYWRCMERPAMVILWASGQGGENSHEMYSLDIREIQKPVMGFYDPGLSYVIWII